MSIGHRSPKPSRGGRQSTTIVAVAGVMTTTLALLALIPQRSGAQPEPWSVFTVDAAGDVGQYASLVVNLAGRPHLSYHNATTPTLKYAPMNTSLVFAPETVTMTQGAGWWTSLSMGELTPLSPYIAHYDPVSADLLYTRRVTRTWETTILDAEGDVGAHTAIDIDSGDFPHVVYDDTTNGTLKYMRQDASGWITETIAPGTTGSLVVDIGGNPHVSFQDPGTKRLMYATRTNASGWSVETVDASGDSGSFSAIALDPTYQPHIAFYGATGGDLFYATHDTSWHTVPVDTEGDVGAHVDLYIDNLGRRYVAYQDATNGTVKFALNAGAGWEMETVAPNGGLPPYTSIGVGGSRGAHIGFYGAGEDGGDLFMAAKGYPTPTPTGAPSDTPGTPGTATNTPGAGTPGVPTYTPEPSETPGQGTPSLPTYTPVPTNTPGPGTPSLPTWTPEPTATNTPGPGTPGLPTYTPEPTETPGQGTPGIPTFTPGPGTPGLPTSTPGPGTPSLPTYTPGTPTVTHTPGPGTPSLPTYTPEATGTLGPGTPSATPTLEHPGDNWVYLPYTNQIH